MSDTPPHRVIVRAITRLTPDVRRYLLDRPDGYTFQPGQATEVALDRDGWREETRPFTFTSLPDAEHLEFTIKSYPDHDGVTEQIGMLQVGDALRIGEAWGAITDHGAGTFVAGGAGVTPFIAILRARLRRGEVGGCHLILSAAEEAGLILRDEWDAMPGLRVTYVVTDDPSSRFAADRLDATALKELTGGDVDQRFYVCGPPAMVEDITAALEEIGADPDGITLEE